MLMSELYSRRKSVAYMQPCTGYSRQIRSGNSLREQRRNFAPYSNVSTSNKKKEKGQSWTVRFVCLDSTEACTAPCTPSAKEQLLTAGLGEKEITVPEITCTKDEFNDLILGSFPRLKACGGYELMRCIPNSKHLEIISSRIAQSPKLLKTTVGNGRVFIRPIQKDISLVPDESICSSPEVNPQ